MKMPFIGGICDVMNIKKIDQKGDEITIWEIKASVEQEWKDNALFQAVLYALMSGKKWCRIILLNPFRNEKCSYYFKMEDIMGLRQLVINDTLSWNISCWFAKNIKSKGTPIKVTNNYVICMKENPSKTKFLQITLINFLSPSKFDIIYNFYIQDKPTDKQRKQLNTLEKLYYDSKITEEEALKQVYDYLNGPQCVDSKIYYCGDCEFEDKTKFIPFTEFFDDSTIDVEQEFKLLEENIHYVNDSLTELLCIMSYLSKKFKLV